MMETGEDQVRPSGREISEGIVEKACKLLSALALMVMMVIVGVDIVTRWGFNFSFEVSDEIGAYMLVAITFLSLPVSHIHGAFHRVEFLQARLSRRAQVFSRFVFELLALLFASIFLWQFIRLVLSSWRFEDRAPTYLETPLWLPRSLLVAGMAALCISLCRSLISDLRQLRQADAAAGSRNGS
jgi:TRAP-type C4-dicarboxylate transport system permease small subunit